MPRVSHFDFRKSFFARIDKVSSPLGCWLWTGGKDKDGYGVCFYQSQTRRASRAAYMEFVGPIPDGLLVCHRCDTPSCCNPDHLFLGTNAENMEDMKSKGRRTGRRGTDSHFAKLSEEQVNEIRKRRATGETLQSLASQFGVDKSTIGYITRGATWKDAMAADNPDMRFRLTDAQVAEIRTRYAAGGVSQRALAAEYGVSQAAVYCLTTGKRRKAA